ncbi:hypothetical protein [Sporosarcina sp. 6E9]|uniref:hypothetical protein n=1 Tax=Sporosarcina sp. 6E9 TaxID=2819235 RepID=UPI001B309859|nr:hypothetical protein [Sporosarcina sp. 6E9]
MVWDIIGPVLIILFTGTAAWGIIGYFQRDLYPLIVGAVAELLICYIFGSSIGKLLLIVPLLQLGLAGFIIYKKINIYKKEASE